MSSGEFDIISRYFSPLVSEGKPAFGLTDDAAVLSPPVGQDLVFTKDAMVGGIHFFPNDPPDLIARKAMRVNLSDLAAMGAKPLGYLLSLAIPKDLKNIDEWVKAFSRGLETDQDEFGWSLLGGDTVATTGPITISLTAIGTVTQGCALRRKGAKAGDDIYVSGTLGDSALGLKCLQGDLPKGDGELVKRYHLPNPRLELGQKLLWIASAAMDISDGLAGDIRHICTLNGVGAKIDHALIPISVQAGNILESFPSYKSLIWNGGDDYELLFTAPPHDKEMIQQISLEIGLPLTKIGTITSEDDIVIHNAAGANLLLDDTGFRHF